MLKYIFLLLFAGSLIFASTGCSKSNKTARPAIDSNYFARIKFVVQNNTDYSVFTQGLLTAGVLDTLASPGPFTLLLSKQDPGIDPIYQIWPGAISLDSLPVKINQEIPTLNGNPAYVSKYIYTNNGVSDTLITVNGMNVTRADIPAANGLINTMANPPVALEYNTLDEVVQAEDATRLLAVIFQRVNLRALLQGTDVYTLLAPTTTAFTSDASFTWLNIKTVEDVYAADSAKLAVFVKNLIIPGRLFVNDFSMNWLLNSQQTYTTLAGETVTVNVTENGAQYSYMTLVGQGNSAPIYLFSSGSNGNYPARNGVMILLSSVLSPN